MLQDEVPFRFRSPIMLPVTLNSKLMHRNISADDMISSGVVVFVQ